MEAEIENLDLSGNERAQNVIWERGTGNMGRYVPQEADVKGRGKRSRY